jgi:hypothetical protein
MPLRSRADKDMAKKGSICDITSFNLPDLTGFLLLTFLKNNVNVFHGAPIFK